MLWNISNALRPNSDCLWLTVGLSGLYFLAMLVFGGQQERLIQIYFIMGWTDCFTCWALLTSDRQRQWLDRPVECRLHSKIEQLSPKIADMSLQSPYDLSPWSNLHSHPTYANTGAQREVSKYLSSQFFFPVSADVFSDLLHSCVGTEAKGYIDKLNDTALEDRQAM